MDASSQRPMERALAQARAAGARGEVPIGCVIVGPDGAVLAEAANRTEADRDPTAHAELLAIRAAAKRLGAPRLVGCDLYVTLEPCPMCAQAIAFARLRRGSFRAAPPQGRGPSAASLNPAASTSLRRKTSSTRWRVPDSEMPVPGRPEWSAMTKTPPDFRARKMALFMAARSTPRKPRS